MTQKNIAVFICSGCEIGNCIDVNALSVVASDEYKIQNCKNHDSLCSQEGVQLIKKDISENIFEGIIIAACSPRYYSKEFDFGDELINERVNLREQVVWTHDAEDEDTQMLAEDLLRMGIAKVQNIVNPKAFIAKNLRSDVLVVGGGITGITATIEGAKAGYKMILIEKKDELGGYARILHKQLPQKSPYKNLEEPSINSKIKELEKYQNIEVFTSSEILEISGQPGLFEVKFNEKGETRNLKVASIVMATGWKPYDANKLTEFNYTDFPDVITNVEFEKMAAENRIIKPSDGKKVESVLFIQCAGSRDDKHLSYCSNFCCGTTLKQAKYIRESNPDALVYVVYKDIRTPGRYEHFYKEMQNDDRLFLTKGEVCEVIQSNGGLSVGVKNTLIGEDISLDVDMVVLATGMTPANTEDLNLTYRLGKGLPELKYNFTDSNVICFPYETRRTGIYAAGSVRSPMDMSSSMEDAMGATLKAIQ
ncbi:MAG: CoB--CoM heterodisulfide reductase iron-sulfur subunit A family protein, partial [Bacteroidetes bacterium]|nr:CoB--CoM heterodisulfide reductase iron-sulfur subunit A family protein [Bacteroidota bacterium]